MTEIKEKCEKLTTHFIEIKNNKTEIEVLLKNEIETLKSEGKDNRTQLKDLEESAKVLKAECVNLRGNFLACVSAESPSNISPNPS